MTASGECTSRSKGNGGVAFRYRSKGVFPPPEEARFERGAGQKKGEVEPKQWGHREWRGERRQWGGVTSPGPPIEIDAE